MTEAVMAVDRLDRKRHNYFFLKAYKQRHNATYEGAVELRLHRYQSSSGIVPRCQRHKWLWRPQSNHRPDIKAVANHLLLR